MDISHLILILALITGFFGIYQKSNKIFKFYIALVLIGVISRIILCIAYSASYSTLKYIFNQEFACSYVIITIIFTIIIIILNIASMFEFKKARKFYFSKKLIIFIVF